MRKSSLELRCSGENSRRTSCLELFLEFRFGSVGFLVMSEIWVLNDICWTFYLWLYCYMQSLHLCLLFPDFMVNLQQIEVSSSDHEENLKSHENTRGSHTLTHTLTHTHSRVLKIRVQISDSSEKSPWFLESLQFLLLSLLKSTYLFGLFTVSVLELPSALQLLWLLSSRTPTTDAFLYR